MVYEDAHLLVVNKAAGMVVHPAPGHTGGTLVNAVLHHCRLPAMRLVPGQAPPASLDAGWTSGVCSLLHRGPVVQWLESARFQRCIPGLGLADAVSGFGEHHCCCHDLSSTVQRSASSRGQS